VPPSFNQGITGSNPVRPTLNNKGTFLIQIYTLTPPTAGDRIEPNIKVATMSIKYCSDLFTRKTLCMF